MPVGPVANGNICAWSEPGIPRPAGWVKFLPPAQAKEIIVASIISAVSAKNFRFNCLAVFLPGQLPFLHFAHCIDIHTPWRTWADM